MEGSGISEQVLVCWWVGGAGGSYSWYQRPGDGARALCVGSKGSFLPAGGQSWIMWSLAVRPWEYEGLVPVHWYEGWAIPGQSPGPRVVMDSGYLKTASLLVDGPRSPAG